MRSGRQAGHTDRVTDALAACAAFAHVDLADLRRLADAAAIEEAPADRSPRRGRILRP